MTTRTVPALAEPVALRRLAVARWSIHPTSRGVAVVGTSWEDSSDDVRDAVVALTEHHGWAGRGVPDDVPLVLSSPGGGRRLVAQAYLEAGAALIGRLLPLAQAVNDARAREASRLHTAYRTRQLARRRRNRR